MIGKKSVGCLLVLTTLFLVWWPASSRADSEKAKFTIEPLIGYERVHFLLPVFSLNNRVFYGGRLGFGVPLLSAELEYDRASISEAISAGDFVAQNSSHRIKLGMASQLIKVWTRIRLGIRLGAQWEAWNYSATNAAAATATVSGSDLCPYGGIFLLIQLSSHFRLNNGLTLIANDFPHSQLTDFQFSSGLGFSF